MKNKKQFSLIFIVAIIVALVGCAKKETPITETKPVLFEEKLKSAIEKFAIPEKNINREKDPLEIRFPKSKLIEEFVAELFDAANNTEYKVTEAKHFTKKKPEFVSMIFESKKKINNKIFLKIILTNEVSARTSHIALIIKNLENLSKENADNLLSFSLPLNYILTPWQQKTDTIPDVFSKIESPVLLEIPIEENETNEAETKFARKKYTIYQSDNKKKIDSKINTITNFYPTAVGLFSRTGNLVLNSRETARDFLQELKTKKRNLIFLDARPKKLNKNGVSKEISEELLISYDTISISLPSKNNLSSEEWEIEFKNAIDRAARSRNSVILISADDNFVSVLAKNLNYIQNKGIEFVPINNSKGE